MKTTGNILRVYAVRMLAVALMLVTWQLARLPELSASARSAMASRFGFDATPLPELSEGKAESIRRVHSSLKHIAAWISSVGASVSLNDLDGDGLANDVSWVDVRKNQVVVAPAPGGARYAAFVLVPAGLPYDEATMAPMGVLPGDFNEDGLRDVLVYFWGRTPIIYFRRAGEPAGEGLSADAFTARELQPQVERWFTNAATQADLDGDGHIDLIIANYFPDGAHILDENAVGPEQMQDSMSRAYNGGRKHILRWAGAAAGINPAARYDEVSSLFNEEVNRGWTLAVGTRDLDGDLLPEIYFANDFGPDRLLHNRSVPGRLAFQPVEGRRSIGTPRSKVLGRDSFKSMGVDFGDIDGDGTTDLYVSNIAAEYALEESHFVFLNTGNPHLLRQGIAPFVDRSEPLGVSRSGWGWDSRLGDFDNDSAPELLQAVGFLKGNVNRWPELHEVAMGNDQLLRHPAAWHNFQLGDEIRGSRHNPFFVRSASGRYYDIAREIGIDQEHISRGIATADVDRDGLLDYAMANQWESSWFYHNISARPGRSLGLDLRLPIAAGSAEKTRLLAPGEIRGAATIPAIGAQARITLPGGRVLIGEVDGGNGHSGKRSPELHFGLGDLPAGELVLVELRWRDLAGNARTETFRLQSGWHTILLASSTYTGQYTGTQYRSEK
jgi:hypothetical protein